MVPAHRTELTEALRVRPGICFAARMRNSSLSFFNFWRSYEVVLL